ncbi:MAG: hypothetical protein KAY22_14750 [Rhizorhabdus sp.]|uniref:hypothetical protein n=1 Tax=Rhizorhabdus sp. TaxID=1968843 RepID=UPI001B5B0970|nr:hypothetical protein [Rhizorhabdus sp.]MBP8233561.1 hypothetical protein [Rhizorhabdus sp.]
MIKSLAGATIVVPDLDVAIAAYRDWLGYRPAPVAIFDAAEAAAWNIPQAAGARASMLTPESGEARFLRLVEGAPDPAYRPMGALGWAAIEIIVQDVEALATRLADPASPFAIIGAPAVLDFDFTDKIKAMQATGPGGEVLYLTEVAEPVPGFDLPEAKSFVGQPFILVMGSRGIDAAARSYVERGRALSPIFEARIEVLSDAHGIDRAHRHRLATVAFDEASLIEIDDFPASAIDRPASSIGLPSGIAIAHFHGGTAGEIERLIGGAGEWIEIRP